jgi:hypothetical protein
MSLIKFTKPIFTPNLPRNTFMKITTLLVCLIFLAPSNLIVVSADTSPTPLEPMNGIKITTVSEIDSTAIPPVAIPNFSWTSVEDATMYRLQLSQEIAFNTKIEFTTPHTSYTPTSLNQLNDGIWYWRVRVESPTASQYSDTWTFIKAWASANNLPILIAPAAGATIDFFDAPVFSWQPVTGAAQYRFQISSAPDFSSLVYNTLTLATAHQPTSKFANGSYYWRVIPIDVANREGTSSVARTFNINYTQVPLLLEPEDNSFPTFTPTFRWTAVRGASRYELEYSSDPSFNTSVMSIDTYNTTYTPSNSLPNDINYYWRVRAVSGSSISSWSTVWSFVKQWYIEPDLLTPVELHQHVHIPLFSWAPVPGASYYKIEIDTELDFIGAQTANTSNPYYSPKFYDGDEDLYYWRVTPYDRQNHQGSVSQTSSYVSRYDSLSPNLVYPLYYYIPNNYPDPDQDVDMHPHEDRTASLPIFMWHRVTNPSPIGGIATPAYRLEVSTSPLFLWVDWTVDTENTFASPSASNPFTPTTGIDYFWRVCPLDGLAGNCLETTDPSPVPWWSEIWRTRIDTSQTLTPTADIVPQLLRPVHGEEFVEMTPLFEWISMQGADSYEIEISEDPDFSSTIYSETVLFPVFAPTTGIAQRNQLNRLEYGTYYWRVRGLSGGSPLGEWSDTWRFQVASQSEWLRTRTLGNPSNRLLIASDPLDTADTNYELTTLYATQDSDNWYFGFDATTSIDDMVYALYLDLDHIDSSGATSDALPYYDISTIPAHQPEYAIYINQQSENFSANQVAIYSWNGTTWDVPQSLGAIGGGIFYDSGNLEIMIPNTAIGMEDTTGSYSLALVSLPPGPGGGSPQDSVPSTPDIPGGDLLSRFTSVSERMMLLIPPTNTSGDPTTYPSIPTFYWEYPTGSLLTAPWAGAKMEVNLDPQFTGVPVVTYDETSTASYYDSTSHPWPDDFDGDNTYYWRIRPRYLDGDGQFFGVWSQSKRFERQGFIPQNLQESISFATPTFSWDLVEGAAGYDLQLDNDPNFGSLEINLTNSSQNTYTPLTTLYNGTYYWRVRARRYSNVLNEWSTVKSFTLSPPIPDGLTPDDPQEQNVVPYAPTLCWNPLIVSVNDDPVMAAYKYRVQVSRGDPTFSDIYDNIDTEQACFTPTQGYDDGKYYWRVAMIDGQNKVGEFSEVAEFTKQYPATNLISPEDGSILTSSPTFKWTSVHGAASYKIDISKYDTYSPLFDTISTHTVQYTPKKVFDDDQVYYWRVAIVDKNNNIGPFNNATIILNPGPGEELYLPILSR